MSNVIHFNKSEVIARLMEEAALTKKPFGPFVAELFPTAAYADGHAHFDAVIIPFMPDDQGHARKLDTGHVAFPLREVLIDHVQDVRAVYGYHPADDENRTLALEYLQDHLLEAYVAADGTPYEFSYE